MNYLRFRELFSEFSAKLEEQYTYYLDSVIGFSVLHDRVVEHQRHVKNLLGDHEFADTEFQDTCSTLYKQISGHDVTPLSLSPVMKQGVVKARNKKNGYNTLILGANCVVALYSYWEEYLRLEIGIAKGVLDQGVTNDDASKKILNEHVASDIWGDLRHLRHSIVHCNGIAYPEITKCKIVKCFKPGGKVELDFEKMRAIFMLLAVFRNELDQMSRPPPKRIRLPG